ncbi:MAG TPA: glycosyltransferase family 2 protein [Acidimicrobiia bacterium]|jgi:glycosyltransferase involved in cell wall biosynthesis
MSQARSTRAPNGIDNPVDDDARAGFEERYGHPDLGPICIVIAAYRERASIGKVLDELPSSVCGKRATVLVVDDGSGDGTAEVAREHGAFVCAPALNRGQGAALRLAYTVAAAHGAEYLVSLDADGQYDPADIPSILAPVVDGEADLVTGSRRLGSSYRGDRFRQLGVLVYGTSVRVLTGAAITDPSFGLRAMRAEVPLGLRLDEPQFQASELLVGAIMRGYRVAERPATMRRRASGDSRKGASVAYGYRFGRVLLRTWWRARRAAPS